MPTDSSQQKLLYIFTGLSIIFICLAYLLYERSKTIDWQALINSESVTITSPLLPPSLNVFFTPVDAALKPSLKDEYTFPTPPAGFEWYVCENMQAFFLKPTDWIAKESPDSAASQTCVLSMENPTAGQPVVTYLSVTKIPQVTLNKGESATKYAQSSLEQLPALIKDSLQIMTPTQVAHGFAGQSVSASSHSYHLNLANPTTDSLYSIVFTSSQGTWQAYYAQYGQTMLGTIGISPSE